MILHFQGSLIAVFLIFGNRVRASPSSSTTKLEIVMNHMTIVNDMKFCLSGNLSLIVKHWTMKSNIISLPLSWSTTGIHQRLGPSVQGSALPVRISDILVGIQNLDFILPHKKDPAVSTPLPTPLCFTGCGKFNM